VSLTVDSAGRMLAGTESPGRLYRFDASDRPFVMLDTGMSELRAISSTAAGVVFAAGVAKGSETTTGGETTSVAVTLAATATTGAAAGTGGSSTSSTPPRRSVVYRIEPDGRWEEIWTTADVVYDLAAQTDGNLLVATGPEGRLYSIDGNLDVALFTGVDARQITAFATSGPGASIAAFATANPGRLVAVGAGDQPLARYTSAVRDTESIATWGLLRWEATGLVELQTRSGNTAVPDDSWSEWSAPYRRREGELVTSPTARFIQWRAALTRPANGSVTPRLTGVTLAYLPRNNRPVVSEVTTYPMGVVFIRPFVNDDSAIAGLDDATVEARRPQGETPPTPPSPTRRVFQKGLQTITWKADDEDDDQLSYTLQYRRDGQAEWQDLKAGLTTTTFVWDTTTAADGRYFLRVRASDAGSNTSDRALAGTRESDPIDVDNTVPTLSIEATRDGAVTRLTVIARDAASAIERLEYSMRGSEWRIVYPADGLADSLEERYEITLPGDVSPADVMVRTADRLQNSASAPGAPR
jgi:hypothetical protein